MELETKFLRLKTPVTIGSLFGAWTVCWLGGWTKYKFDYLVMVVRARLGSEPKQRIASNYVQPIKKRAVKKSGLKTGSA